MIEVNQPMLRAVISGALVLMSSCSGPNYPPPLSPEASLAQMQLEEGFHIEVFAAEPYVIDPVDVEYDEFGNIYAVEMLDYPYKPSPGKGRCARRRR